MELTLNQATKGIVSTLNIKEPTEYILFRVSEEIKNYNLVNFVLFVESSRDHIDLKFENGFGKFLTIAKWYREKVAKKMAESELDTVEGRAKALANKVRKVSKGYDERVSVYGIMGKRVASFKIREGYFSDEEKSIVRSLGNLAGCISLQKSQSGFDAFEERVVVMMKSKAIGVAKKRLTGGSDEAVLPSVSTLSGKVRGSR